MLIVTFQRKCLKYTGGHNYVAGNVSQVKQEQSPGSSHGKTCDNMAREFKPAMFSPTFVFISQHGSNPHVCFQIHYRGSSLVKQC